LRETDIALDGNGYIDMFRQWLNHGNHTWKELLDIFVELGEKTFATDLRRKIEKGGNTIKICYVWNY